MHKEEPIDVALEGNSSNAPEPDLSVLREASQHYKKRNPQTGDILLAVEVADSTLAFDLSKKADLYARAGIPNYWVFGINNRRLIVHRQPIEGKYRSIVEYRERESVAPVAAPESQFRVATALVS